MAGHAFSAVSAAEQTGKQIDLLSARSGPGILPVQILCRLKDIFVNDCRYGVLHNKPLFFRHRSPLMHLITDNLLPALAHDPNIQGVLEHTRDRGRRPQAVVMRTMGVPVPEALGAFVSRRVWDSIPIEPSGNPGLAHSLADKPAEYVPHHLSGIPVNHKGVFVVRVLGVAIGGKRADKLPLFPLVPEGPAHIGGGLIGVLFIHKSCDADLQAMDNFWVQKRVDSRLVQGDKPGIV